MRHGEVLRVTSSAFTQAVSPFGRSGIMIRSHSPSRASSHDRHRHRVAVPEPHRADRRRRPATPYAGDLAPWVSPGRWTAGTTVGGTVVVVVGVVVGGRCWSWWRRPPRAPPSSRVATTATAATSTARQAASSATSRPAARTARSARPRSRCDGTTSRAAPRRSGSAGHSPWLPRACAAHIVEHLVHDRRSRCWRAAVDRPVAHRHDGLGVALQLGLGAARAGRWRGPRRASTRGRRRARGSGGPRPGLRRRARPARPAPSVGRLDRTAAMAAVTRASQSPPLTRMERWRVTWAPCAGRARRGARPSDEPVGAQAGGQRRRPPAPR